MVTLSKTEINQRKETHEGHRLLFGFKVESHRLVKELLLYQLSQLFQGHKLFGGISPKFEEKVQWRLEPYSQ